MALLAYFALHLFTMVFDYAAETSHVYAVDLLSLVLSVMLLQGSLVAARWTAFFTSARLAATALGAVALPLLVYTVPEVRRSFAFDSSASRRAPPPSRSTSASPSGSCASLPTPRRGGARALLRGAARSAKPATFGAALCAGFTLIAGTIFGVIYSAYRQHVA